jgi:hypothetical protein
LRFVFHLVLMLGIALALGFGLSWYALTDGKLFGTVEIGPWTAWRDVGRPAPDPYTRAFIVRSGGLELGAGEGLQFVATTDDQGRSLTRDCTYVVSGRTPTAKFWTLVAVAPDTGALLSRPDGPPAMVSTRLARLANGDIDIYVGTRLSPGNWYQLTGTGPYSLILTLYDASSPSGAALGSSTLPSIRRERCA